MKIHKRYLLKHKAPLKTIEWYDNQKNKDIDSLFKASIEDNKPLVWFNWYLTKKLKKIDKIKYAIFAARQVLHIAEEESLIINNYLRKAIEEAEVRLKKPNKQTKNNSANYVVDDAYYVDHITHYAYRVPIAVRVIDFSVRAASASNAADTAYYASNAAFNAYSINGRQTMIKIIEYGIKLLKGELS